MDVIPEEDEELDKSNRGSPAPSHASFGGALPEVEVVDFLAAFKELSQADKDKISSLIGAHHAAKVAAPENLDHSLNVIATGGASNLLFSDDVEEDIVDSHGPKPYKLHHDIRKLVELRVYLPLSLFLNKSIEDITLTSIPRETIVVKGVKSHVLKIDYFPDEKKMDATDWIEAWMNYLEFFKTVSTDTIVARWERHFKILSSKDNLRNNFRAILQFDICYRREYTANPFKFDQLHFDTMFSEEREKIRDLKTKDLEEKFYRSGRPVNGNGFPRHSSVRYDPYPRPSSASNTAGSSSFRGGSGDKSGVPICLICARLGHTYAQCSFDKTEGNRATFSKHVDGRIVSAAGGASICIWWNLKGKIGCTRDHPNQHLCSFCGARSHHACSRVCAGSSTL